MTWDALESPRRGAGAALELGQGTRRLGLSPSCFDVLHMNVCVYVSAGTVSIETNANPSQ